MSNDFLFVGLVAVGVLMLGSGAYASYVQLTDDNGTPIFDDVTGEPIMIPESDAQAATESQSPSTTADVETPYWKTTSYYTYADSIAHAENQYSIPPDLLARLLYQESRFNPSARNPSGATGIAQFMPATAASLGINPLDPVQSIFGAGRYLRQLFDQFNDWANALAAYNWGPGNMRKYLNGTLHNMPSETQTYVASITSDVAVV